ncbi:hypothetical protein FQR65_LT02018 [Abscondita terminalis]|nr:hypothetical protein FQR65_LT02018 [Abscondita terminalis]
MNRMEKSTPYYFQDSTPRNPPVSAPPGFNVPEYSRPPYPPPPQALNMERMDQSPPSYFQDPMPRNPPVNEPQGFRVPEYSPPSFPSPPPQNSQYLGPSNFTNINVASPAPQAPTVITNQYINPVHLGPKPQPHTCSYCNAITATKVTSMATTKTHLWALCLCLFLCWPCVCMPYCLNSCRIQNHYCGNCGTFIGTYNP